MHIAVILVSGAVGVVPTSHHYDDWDAQDGRTSPCTNTIYEYDSRKCPISDWHALVRMLSCLLGVSMCRGNMPCTYIGMVKDRGVQSLKHKARVTKCVCEEQPLASTKMAWL